MDLMQQRGENRLAKKSVIVQYTVGYLSLFLLVFLFGSILVGKVFSFIKNEIKESTSAQLAHIVNNLESNMSDFSEVANRIYVDSKLQKQAFVSQGNSALNGIKQLQNYKYSMKLVDMMFLCYNADEIYTTQGKSKSATLAYETLKLTEESGTRLIHAFKEREDRLREVLATTQGTSDLLYLFPVPSSKKTGDGAVGFIIKEKTLQKELSQALRSYDSFALMVLNTGEVIARIDNTGKSNLTEKEKEAIYGSMITGENTEKLGYTSIRCESTLMGFTLSIAINTEQVLSKALKMQWGITVSGAVLFILSFATLFIINQFNYKPIKSLRHLAESRGENLKGNELEAVRRVMEQTFEEQKQKDINLQKFDQAMKTQIVFMLFGGVIQDDNRLDQIMKTYNANLKGPSYSVIGILTDSVNDCFNSYLSTNSDFCIFNAVPHKGKILVSILVSLADKDVNSVLRAALGKRLREAAKKSGMTCLAITCGMVYSRLSRIHHSYKEMVSAIEICQTNGTDAKTGLCTFEALAKVSTYKYCFAPGQVGRLKAELGSLDKEKAVKSFQEMIRCLDQAVITMEVRRFHYYAIVQYMMDLVQSMDVSDKLIERLFMISTMEPRDFESGMLQFIDRFISEKQPKKDCIDDILRYMEDHFADSSMSLEQLADVFHMTSGNVSKYIKNKTGQRYSDYLSKLRMDEACRLLRETDIEIQTLILQVGYFDPASFTKKFKALYSMTPSDYRDCFVKVK